MDRIERNAKGAVEALRTDNAEWIKADLAARMLSEAIVKTWYESQEDPALRTKFRNSVVELVDASILGEK